MVWASQQTASEQTRKLILTSRTLEFLHQACCQHQGIINALAPSITHGCKPQACDRASWRLRSKFPPSGEWQPWLWQQLHQQPCTAGATSPQRRSGPGWQPGQPGGASFPPEPAPAVLAAPCAPPPAAWATVLGQDKCVLSVCGWTKAKTGPRETPGCCPGMMKCKSANALPCHAPATTVLAIPCVKSRSLVLSLPTRGQQCLVGTNALCQLMPWSRQGQVPQGVF